ncbi:MAG: PKD domain-containing protein [Bacteroidia bacterium]
MQSTKLVALAVFILFFSSQKIFAIDKTSINSGNWSSATTWDPAGVPSASDNVIVKSGTTVTMDMSAAVCLSLLIEGIAEWKLNKTLFVGTGGAILNGGMLTVNGTLGTLDVSGDLRVINDTSVINGVNLKISGATIVDAGAVVKITSTSGAKQITDLIINGTWDCTVSDSWQLSGNLIFNGTDFISGGGTYTFTGINKSISGKPIAIQNIKVDVGAVCINATSLVITGGLTGSGIFSQGINSVLNISTQSAKFNVSGFNSSAAGNTVIYDRLGVQTIHKPDDGAYYNLGISGNNIKTTSGTLKINGNLNIQSTLDVSTSNDSLKLGGNWLNTGSFVKRKGTVILDGNSSQTITNTSDEFFYNLTCAGNGTKILTGNINVDSTFQINAGNNLDVSNSFYAITLKGNFINKGVFKAQKGTVIFNGTGAQIIGGTSITSFYNIILNNSVGINLTNSENLIGTLTLMKGTFTSTGQNLTLISDAAGTASIASIPTGANFVGNITMQRYLPPGQTGWRFLASAVSGATLQQWTNCFYTTGFVGSNDPGNAFVSIYTYNESAPGVFSNGYVGATNTSNSILNTGGYWCYVGPTPLTIKVTGPPNKLTQTFSPTYTASGGASQDGWNMISNTYPSAIDWNAASGWTKTKINNAIYIWNSQLQQYASYVSGIGTNGGSNIIPSSQSFWVQTNGSSPKLVMTENVKSSSNKPFTKIENNHNVQSLSIHLRINGNSYSDETFILFNKEATMAFDSLLDAYKIVSTSTAVPSISSLSQNADFSINSIPELDSSLSIPLRVKVGTSGTYTISSDNLTNIPKNSCLVLEDLLTGIKTDLKNTNTYSFTISDTTNAPRFLLHVSAGMETKYFPTDCEHATALVNSNGNGTFIFTWKNNSGIVLKTITTTNTSDTLAHLTSGTYYVTANNPNFICGSITDTITIPAQTPVLAEFDANSDTSYFAIGHSISFSNYSAGANSFLWKFGDGNTDINFDSQHTYNVAGIYTVTLIASNENCEDSIQKIITILDNSTGIKSINPLQNLVKLVTTPNGYYLNFSFQNLSDVIISAINMLGQKIISDEEIKVQNNNVKINFSPAAKGIYYINVRKGNQNIGFKVVQ